MAVGKLTLWNHCRKAGDNYLLCIMFRGKGQCKDIRSKYEQCFSSKYSESLTSKSNLLSSKSLQNCSWGLDQLGTMLYPDDEQSREKAAQYVLGMQKWKWLWNNVLASKRFLFQKQNIYELVDSKRRWLPKRYIKIF